MLRRIGMPMTDYGYTGRRAEVRKMLADVPNEWWANWTNHQVVFGKWPSPNTGFKDLTDEQVEDVARWITNLRPLLDLVEEQGG